MKLLNTKEKEYKDQLGKLEKEMGDLTSEQQQELQMNVRWSRYGEFHRNYDKV